MNTDGAAGSRDVVVIADYHSHLPSALEVALALAHSRRLALRGLFVEDPDLALVCSLPFSQEVTLTSARPRALERERLRRTLEQVSRRFQQLLSEGAEQASLSYSFGSVPGRRQALDPGAGGQADYLVLGQPGRVQPSPDGVLRAALVQADIEAILPVLESIHTLCRGRRLELLLVDGEQGGPGEEALQRFVGGHRDVACRRLPVGRIAEVFRVAGRSPDLVVASRQCAPALLELLLQRSACPVILTA